MGSAEAPPPLIAAPGVKMPMEVHWAAVKSGEVNILMILDKLSWFSTASDWKAWRSFLCAVYALPMDAVEQGIYRKCTGRSRPPSRKAREVWVVAGRRARKSAIMALMAIYEGAFRDHRPCLAKGEIGRIPIIAKDMDDAGAIFGFAKAILDEPPMAHLLAEEPTGHDLQLTTQVELVIVANKITGGRSRANVASFNDEIAFWPSDEAAMPDTEVLRGIRGGMANVKDPLLVAMSNAFAKRGQLYENKQAHWGRDDDDILVWMADTLTMHDNENTRVYVANQWRDDPIAAASEVGSPDRGIEFRDDVQAYVSPETVDALVSLGRVERPAQTDVQYYAFCDPSGGSGDAMTLSICHWDQRRGMGVQDFVREWPTPFKPGEVVSEAALDLQRYGLRKVMGDYYAGEWPTDRFKDNGIMYSVSPRTKTEIFLAFLPFLNNRQVELLDYPKQTKELKDLERRVSLAGRTSTVGHPQGKHDDVINSGAGALLRACERGRFDVEAAHKEAQRGRPARDNIEQHVLETHRAMRARIAQRQKDQDQRSGQSGGRGAPGL